MQIPQEFVLPPTSLARAALISLVLVSAPALAEPPDDTAAWGADDDIGFAETTLPEPVAPAEAQADAEPSPLTFHGFQRVVLGLWVERLRDNPFATGRQVLQLELAYEHAFLMGATPASLRLRAAGQVWFDFAYQHQRDEYDEPTLEAYEWGSLPREIDVAFTLGPLRLSLGRQVVNWGQGEVLSLLDLVNPRDLREPGLTPPQELRVPVLMTRADLALGRHRLEAVVVHEVSYGLMPPPLGSFSPLRRLLLETPALGPALAGRELRFRHGPEPTWLRGGAQQYHARWVFLGDGFDLGIHLASLLEPLGVAILPDPAEFAEREMQLPVLHPRFELLGASGAAPVWDLLLRWEVAVSFARPIAVRRTGTALLDIGAERHQQFDALLGVTYVLSGSTHAGLEVAQSYLPKSPAREHNAAWEPLWPVEATRASLRVDHTLCSQRLRLSFVGLLFGIAELNAWALRGQASLVLSDASRLQLQYITYQPTGRFGVFYGFSRHDRLVLTGEWDFL